MEQGEFSSKLSTYFFGLPWLDPERSPTHPFWYLSALSLRTSPRGRADPRATTTTDSLVRPDRSPLPAQTRQQGDAVRPSVAPPLLSLLSCTSVSPPSFQPRDYSEPCLHPFSFLHTFVVLHPLSLSPPPLFWQCLRFAVLESTSLL